MIGPCFATWLGRILVIIGPCFATWLGRILL